jgi:hypothetical protein
MTRRDWALLLKFSPNRFPADALHVNLISSLSFFRFEGLHAGKRRRVFESRKDIAH